MKNQIVVVLFFFTSSVHLYSQTREPDYTAFYDGIKQYHWETDTCTEGLKYWDDNEFCFCSEGEFIREKYSQIMLKDIRNIFYDKFNRLWIFKFSNNSKTVARYDGENWKIFTSKNSNLPDKKIMLLSYINDTVWVAGDGFIANFEDDDWNVIQLPDLPYIYFYNMLIDTNGSLYLTSEQNGIFKYNGKTLQNFNKSDITIRDSKIDSENNLYFRLSFGDGFAKLKDTTLIIYNSENTGMPLDIVNDFAIDNDDRVWIATNKCLIKYDNETWEIYNSDNSIISSNYIPSVKLNNGIIWFNSTSSNNKSLYTIKDGTMILITNDFKSKIHNIATNSKGITYILDSYYNKNYCLWSFDENNNFIDFNENILNFTAHSGSSMTYGSDIPSNFLLDKNHNLILGRFQFFIKYFGNSTNNSIFNKHGFLNDVNFSFYDKDGGIWFSTDNYIFTLKDNQWLNHPIMKKYNLPILFERSEIQCAIVGVDDVFWIGTRKSLYSLNDTSKVEFNTSNSEIPAENITCIVLDKNNKVWLSMLNNGIASFDGSTWVHYNASNSRLNENFVTDLKIDKKGVLWIGTDSKGLDRFDGENWTNYALYQYGGNGNHIEEIEIDNNGDVYINTGKAVFQMDTLNGKETVRFPYTSGYEITLDADSNLIMHNKFKNIIKYRNGGLTEFIGKTGDDIKFFAEDENFVWIGNRNYEFPLRYNKTYFSNRFEHPKTISGKVFFDENQNGVCDENEKGVNDQLILYNNTYTRTNTFGEYIVTFYIDTTRATILNFNPENGYFITTDSISYTVSVKDSTFTQANFGIHLIEDTIQTGIQKKLRYQIFNSFSEHNVFEVDHCNATVDTMKTNTLNYCLDDFFIEEKHDLLKSTGGIFQDNKGNMWFYGSGKLFNYDGENWNNHYGMKINGAHLNNEYIHFWSMVSDKNNNLWFGTESHGLFRFDGTTWSQFLNENSGLWSNKINRLQVDSKGNLYFLSENRLIIFDGENWNVKTSNNSNFPPSVIDFLIENDTILFISGKNYSYISAAYYYGSQYDVGAYNVFDDSVNYLIKDIYMSASTIHPLYFMYSDSSELIFYHKDNQKPEKPNVLYLFNKQTKKVDSIVAPGSVKGIIEKDKEGNILLPVHNTGLFQYDGINWIDYSSIHPGTPNNINSIYCNNNGTLWLSGGDSIFSVSDTIIQEHSLEIGHQISNCNINTFFTSQNHEYIYCTEYSSNLTNHVFYKKTENGWTEILRLKNNYYINKVKADINDNLYISLYNDGILIFDGKDIYVYDKRNAPFNSCKNLFFDSSNNLYIRAENSTLFRFDGKEWIKIDGLYAEPYMPLVITEGNDGKIWYLNDSILANINGDELNIINRQKISIKHPSHMVVDSKGNLWIYSFSKLEFFDGNNSIVFDTKLEDWSVDNVIGLEIDKYDRLWFLDVGRNNLICMWGDEYIKYDLQILKDLNFMDPKEIVFDKDDNIWMYNNATLVKFLTEEYSVPARVYRNNINGIIYYDLNQNGVKDAFDAGLQAQVVNIKPDNLKMYSKLDGSFTYQIDSSKVYSVEYHPYDNWVLTSDSSKFVVTSDSTKEISFGVFNQSDTSNIVISLNASISRCGFEVPYWINCSNLGTRYEKFTLTLYPDSSCNFVNSFPAPENNFNNDSIQWKLNLLPGKRKQISSVFLMPSIDSMGDTIVFKAKASGQDTVLKYKSFSQTLNCSYDPNDKFVMPEGVQNENFVLSDTTLTYTIRFQNTGTDTAFNITILDTLDYGLDVSSFKFISSSHDVSAKIDSKLVSFCFQNILLPDSNRNEIMSHGYVVYQIKGVESNRDSTLVQNNAYIYFDYNPPIVTNKTINTFVDVIPQYKDTSSNTDDETSVNEDFTTSQKLIYHNSNRKERLIYPNPNNGFFYLQLPGLHYTFELYNLQGQILNNGTCGNGKFDISEYENGIYLLKLKSLSNIYNIKIIKN